MFFVDNLQVRISWVDIKEAFDWFQVVVYVFVSCWVSKEVINFASVQHKDDKELRLAIQHCNGMTLGGRRIKVKMATQVGHDVHGSSQVIPNASLTATEPFKEEFLRILESKLSIRHCDIISRRLARKMCWRFDLHLVE